MQPRTPQPLLPAFLLILLLALIFPRAMAMSTPAASRLVVVSGASRGVGVGICRQVLRSDPAARVVVTARTLAQAEAVRDELNSDREGEAPPRAHAHCLDVADAASCGALAGAVASGTFGPVPPGCPLTLVCNAGVALDLPWFPTPWQPSAATSTLDVNLFGSERLTSAFLPRLLDSTDGRVIFLSSGGGRANMRRMAEDRRSALLDPDISWDDIEGMAATFVAEYEEAASAAIEGGEGGAKDLPHLSPSGYWLQSYGFSKACLGAYCTLLNQKHSRDGLLSVACSPGFIATDMSRTYPKYDTLKTIDEGGEVVAWLATSGREEGEGLKGGVFYTPEREAVSWVADP